MKVLSKFTGILAFCGLLFVMSGWTSEDMAPALVIKDFTCTLFNGDGAIVFGSSSQAVITSSKNGNRVVKCSVKGVANSSGKAVHFNKANTGFNCNAAGAVSTDWHETVSASGNATLTCPVP